MRAEKGKTPAPATSPANANPAAKASPVTPAGSVQPAGVTGLDKQTAASGQFAPYATREEFNLHFLDRYNEGVRTVFEQEKFELLDQMAATARSTRARLIGGAWTVHIIYDALMEPRGGTYNPQEYQWTAHLERLQRWVAQRPDSITARVALAGAQLQYAWRARGGGYADNVTEEGWRLFGERAKLAANMLMDASSLPAKCPEWYLTMQLVARALGESKEMQTAIFEKAVAFDPDYQYFYRAQAELLLPRWEGEEGEMAAFAEQVADRVGGKKGDMIYYQIAASVNCGCASDKTLNGLQWSRIKRGYLATEEQYGEFVGNQNAMAYMAGKAGDPVYAEELFVRIGEGWDKALWRDKGNFQMVRDWAHGAAARNAAEVALKAAEDNLQTPEGRKYDEQLAKAFAASYSATVTECLNRSGDAFLFPFDLVMQVAKNGAVKNSFVSVITPTSTCLIGQVDKGIFPTPPGADYWVKISLQARRR